MEYHRGMSLYYRLESVGILAGTPVVQQLLVGYVHRENSVTMILPLSNRQTRNSHLPFLWKKTKGPTVDGWEPKEIMKNFVFIDWHGPF
jgi:hypothetical protein